MQKEPGGSAHLHQRQRQRLVLVAAQVVVQAGTQLLKHLRGLIAGRGVEGGLWDSGGQGGTQAGGVTQGAER